LGWCLSYVQDAFGLAWTGSYALDGWNRNKANHADRSIPSGVFMPVWFTGEWNGFNYGHVVVYKDGICYSSPYTNKKTHNQIGSIADVERIYGMRYLGWSEDMNGQRVIKRKEVDMLTTTGANVLWRFHRGVSPSAAERKQFVGKVTFDEMNSLL
ncbi:hypothetical protein G3I15_10365, partial [Streptomyces sp. SID10244]|nr:hypothetical protein [Streptomyces sp. SID10244]